MRLEHIHLGILTIRFDLSMIKLIEKLGKDIRISKIEPKEMFDSD